MLSSCGKLDSNSCVVVKLGVHTLTIGSYLLGLLASLQMAGARRLLHQARVLGRSAPLVGRGPGRCLLPAPSFHALAHRVARQSRPVRRAPAVSARQRRVVAGDHSGL